MIKLPQLPHISLEMVKIREEVKMKSRESATWQKLEELVMLFSRLSLGPPSAASPIDIAGGKLTFLVPGFDSSLEKASAGKQMFKFSITGLDLSYNKASAGKNIDHQQMWGLKRDSRSRIGPKSSKGISRFRRRTNLARTTNVSAKGPKPPPACFSSLPTELRLLIFEAARPDPRVVKLSLSKHYKNGDWPRRIYSGAVIPNLLHLCRESRQLALKWYTSPFGRDYDIIKANKMFNWRKWENKVYFDCCRDELYFQCDKCRGLGCHLSGLRGCGLYLVGGEKADLIKRAVFEFSGDDNILTFPFIWFPNLEYFKCVHWEKGLLYRHEAPLADFEEDNNKYDWQEGKSLQDYFNHYRNTHHFTDEHTASRRNVKSFSQVALQPLNTLQDILKDAEIRFTRKRDV
ncbi:hypothetical protein IFR05_014621 [Cadophora sp. M221]|nr:hypothetical protein IFR05_014621 [Cadophora sp. M221]